MDEQERDINELDSNEQEPDIIEMTDDQGNTILMEVLDYFFYNGEEYVILTDSLSEDDGEEAEEIDCYVMQVVTSTDEATGEEMEEFIPIDDPEKEERLMEVANSKLMEDEEADEE